MKKHSRPIILVTALIAAMLVPFLCGCGTAGNQPETLEQVKSAAQYEPLFTSPAEELKESSKPAFTRELYYEALAYEPLLDDRSTQVSMGYWSGKGNHGSLVRVLDSINANTDAAERAIWDEGATSSNQYPSYLEMLEEHWYERSTPKGGKVTIYGTKYADPNPVTFDQADEIWGRYSQRYTDMAGLFKKATGKPAKAWCFVQGARANRIFYKYELPELRKLEGNGSVLVFFATSQDADPANPADWIEGTANAPAPSQ